MEADNTVGSCSGFIPAIGGDVIRLSGYDVKRATSENAINVFDASHTNLGQIVANNSSSYGVFQNTGINWDDVILEKEGVYYWIVPEGYSIAYIRVTGYTFISGASPDGSKMIITKNEEIT